MYKLLSSGYLVRLTDGAIIPDEPENADYAIFLAWAAGGNAPEPADPVPKVFASLNPLQIRQALTKFELRKQVEAYVDAGSYELKDWWQYSPEYSRDNSIVAEVADALGVPGDVVDKLWSYGITI